MSRRKHKTRIATTPAPAPPGAPRATEPERPDGYHDSLPIHHRHAGGVDLGLRSHWAAAPPLPDGTPQVQEFDTSTDGLEALADWLRQRGVTTVALEATGVYWEPLFALLQERGFDVILVAPTYTSGIKGRPKTDRLDCQWIQRLHAHGLLPASFRPPADVAVLRHYLRQRTELVRNGARHIQHMQKALEQMNVKLPEVISDITGLTGRKIITAILAGERDPLRLARLRDKHCQNSAATIARALRGSWRPEALFALQQAWDSWQHYQKQVAGHLQGHQPAEGGAPDEARPPGVNQPGEASGVGRQRFLRQRLDPIRDDQPGEGRPLRREQPRIRSHAGQ